MSPHEPSGPAAGIPIKAQAEERRSRCEAVSRLQGGSTYCQEEFGIFRDHDKGGEFSAEHAELSHTRHPDSDNLGYSTSLAPVLSKASANAPLPSASFRWRSIGKALAQGLYNVRTQAKARLRQAQKSILKIDQACRSGIRQKTRRAGDPQAELARHLAAPLLIEDQQTAIPMLPRQRDRRSLSPIQHTRFLKRR